MTKNIAVIRIRGLTGIRHDIKRTLNQLRLYKKNYCTILPENANYLGMIKKIKDYATWGEIQQETHSMLIKKKAEEYKGRVADSKGKINYERKFFTVNGKKFKKYFRLNPPKGGFERKGIKHSYKEGGALGYRGDKINDLIVRMM